MAGHPPTPRSFASPAAFRAWLRAHHAKERELVVRLFKVHARDRGIGYREALDEALCFGWIDGVVRRFDEDSYLQRFTPRRAGSRWSAINVRRFAALQAAGRVQPAGQKAFDARVSYAADGLGQPLDPAFLDRLRAHTKAWAYYQALPPGYRRIVTFYVMSGKRETTRAARFAKLFDYLKKERRMPLMGES